MYKNYKTEVNKTNFSDCPLLARGLVMLAGELALAKDNLALFPVSCY